MNVVHVCASDIIGGAARAVFRLHRALRAHGGVESRMLVRERASDDPGVVVHAPRLSPRYLLNMEVARRAKDIYWARFASENAVMHSRADVRTGLLQSLAKLPCDLVHLHWLGSNTLSIEEIGQIDRPVVWTLHDMWTFCGAEHYVPDEPGARFRTGYDAGNRTKGEGGPDMNRSVWLRKRHAWKRPMTLVCPSRWMAECAYASVLCRDWPIHRIANPLDLERWKPLPKAQARTLLGLPLDNKIMLFGAIGGERDRRKGSDLLRAVLHELKKFGAEAHLAVFGQSGPVNPEPFPFPVTYLGRLQDDLSMILAYNAADVMLVPSRQDNLPQTAVEAHACGIPVVAFDVGGLSDIVGDRQTGFLAPAFDVRQFAGSVAMLLSDDPLRREMSLAARASALEIFAAPLVARAYVELYAQVLSGGSGAGHLTT